MKKLIRTFLMRYGYDIVKTSDWYATKSGQVKEAQVGKYPITMPGNNTLLRTYALYPDFNTILGRLAAAVTKFYPGMTVVDIGANVGDTIAIIKSATNCPVIAIEGDEISFSFLEKNAKQFSAVSLVCSYVGDKKQEIKVNLDQPGANTTIIPAEKGSNLISIKTVDEILMDERFRDAQIKLLKLDIEGFDTIAIRGSFSMIKKFNPVLFFEYNPVNMKNINEDGLSTLFTLSEYGYHKASFFDHRGNLLVDTTLKNKTEITSLHNYALRKENELGHYDICLFHQNDETLANEFLAAENKIM